MIKNMTCLLKPSFFLYYYFSPLQIKKGISTLMPLIEVSPNILFEKQKGKRPSRGVPSYGSQTSKLAIFNQERKKTTLKKSIFIKIYLLY